MVAREGGREEGGGVRMGGSICFDQLSRLRFLSLSQWVSGCLGECMVRLATGLTDLVSSQA